MNNTLFALILGIVLGGMLRWGFRNLPRERWQILAAVPVEKEEGGRWRGLNLTYYGVFNANAYVLGVALMLVLMGSLGIPLAGTFAMAVTLLLICVPASRWVAGVVEKKAHTFTVGGASFVGIVTAPFAIWLLNATLGRLLEFDIPIIPALAAMAVSYAIGEGIGRLACISFGCCYGSPLSQSPAFIKRLFKRHCFVFTGETKKAAYEGGLEGQKVIPIQAVTSTLYVGTGVLGAWLFLLGFPLAALILAVLITQIWRILSEIVRSDYRGEGRISAYQIMGLMSALYTMILPLLIPTPSGLSPEVGRGIGSIANMGMLLFFEALWVGIFLYTGRSMVTGSTLSFHVHRERI